MVGLDDWRDHFPIVQHGDGDGVTRDEKNNHSGQKTDDPKAAILSPEIRFRLKSTEIDAPGMIFFRRSLRPVGVPAERRTSLIGRRFYQPRRWRQCFLLT
jgi:hypothetical protein